jgi:hypothetical protein
MMTILLRQEKLPEKLKLTNYYNYKKNKIILNKLSNSLPELISRNINLIERLKNKIKVSSFMNNSEHKNQKYLNYFVVSSGKRVNDLKTGLGLRRVMKKGTNYLAPICKHINNDVIIKNGDFLIKEKKLINENTEQETHIKINELIKDINHIIKPNNIEENPITNKVVRSVSDDELLKINNIINQELCNDEKEINDKINFYMNKLNTVAETNPREFHRVAHNTYLNSNIKMINYIKPKPVAIKDQESANLLRIRKHLMQNAANASKKNNKNNNKTIEDDYEKINVRNYMNKKVTNSTAYNNDILNILKNLSNQNQYLADKAGKNLKKINSLIDIKLPYCSNYYRTIKYWKKLQKNKTAKDNSMDNLYSSQKLVELGFKRDNTLDEIKLIKNEISNITDAKIFQKCREIEKQKNRIFFDKKNDLEK